MVSHARAITSALRSSGSALPPSAQTSLSAVRQWSSFWRGGNRAGKWLREQNVTPERAREILEAARAARDYRKHMTPEEEDFRLRHLVTDGT